MNIHAPILARVIMSFPEKSSYQGSSSFEKIYIIFASVIVFTFTRISNNFGTRAIIEYNRLIFQHYHHHFAICSVYKQLGNIKKTKTPNNDFWGTALTSLLLRINTTGIYKLPMIGQKLLVMSFTLLPNLDFSDMFSSNSRFTESL